MIETLTTWVTSLTTTVKNLIVGVALLVLLALAACAGAHIEKWRITADYESRISKLTTSLADSQANTNQLKLAVAEQNNAVEVAAAKTAAAESSRQAAQSLADRLAQQSTARLNNLVASVKAATSCDQVLDAYWELRK